MILSDPMILSGPPAWVVTVFLGLVLGSFASAMAYRIPRGVSWVSARSACTSCGHVLSALDLIPFFSWAFLRGRCRHCRAVIGWRYPLIELSTLLACLAVQGVWGFHYPALSTMLAMPFLVAAVAIDFEFMILPDQINLILAGLGAVFAVLVSSGGFWPALGQAVFAAFLCRAGLCRGVGIGADFEERGAGAGRCKIFCRGGDVAGRFHAARVFDCFRHQRRFSWRILEICFAARAFPVWSRFDCVFCPLRPVPCTDSGCFGCILGAGVY